MGGANPDGVRIALGDVSGHGIPSALLMATARAFVRQRATMPGCLGEVITDVNRLLCRDVQASGSFMTLFFIELEPKSAILRWVRAGHDPGLLYDPEADGFSELKGAGLALGLDQAARYVESSLDHLKPGQIVVLYTDGIWEAHNPEGRRFEKKPAQNRCS